MTDTFDSLRPYLADYLHLRGINPARRFRCLNPEHTDRNPSMGYDTRRHKVHCFACGADYDLFDLLRIEEGLPTSGAALERAKELFGHVDPTPKPAKTASSRQESEAGGKGNAESGGVESATYLSDCAAHRGETDYFASRGIGEETAARFALGYDPRQRCVVLPCAEGNFVRRSVDEKRYVNVKGQPSPLFQPELLSGEEPVFLVEGTFDALSAEELGFHACALNGSGNREKVAAILRGRQKPGLVLVLPDNDTAGEKWAQELSAEFPWLYRCAATGEGKDLNEFLCLDREGALRFLRGAVSDAIAHQPPPYADSSAAAQLDALTAYIAAQAGKPALRTGFPGIDRALDGGLYEGLYVLGAVSSLGKTAFCMQIADQLAMQGRDVLIFSLEMSAFELMARSISRESFQNDETRGKYLAKTVRGVLDGRRYARYSAQEHEHLRRATQSYRDYAGHLYFREGDHETGLETIERAVERHIAETGVKPVVLVDYLQIIAPVDVHFTDKQNLDRIVCALKKLSRRHELTILAISSFNRENYNLEASMTAFKESGGIDYSADVLIGLQARGAGSRSFNLDEEKKKDPRELELKILKNRTGALCDPLALRYYPAFSCFEEGR